MLCRNYTEVTRVYSLFINLLHGSNSLCGVLFVHKHWCWVPTITITSILHGTNIFFVNHNFHVHITKSPPTILSVHISVHISLAFCVWIFSCEISLPQSLAFSARPFSHFSYKVPYIVLNCTTLINPSGNPTSHQLILHLLYLYNNFITKRWT